MKKFLYLVQSKEGLPPGYEALQSDVSDVLVLAWKKPVPDAIYFPMSSWTQGRNRLLRAALDKEGDYLYYIFLDDDILFIQGDWRTFEAALLEFKPAVAVPYYPEYRAARHSMLQWPAQTTVSFDAIYNAFHRDVVYDGVILPYHSGLDDKSWHFSQWIVIALSRLLFNSHTLQINRVHITNNAHGEYPQGLDFSIVDNWYRAEVLQPNPIPIGWRRAWQQLAWKVRRVLGCHFSKPSAAPAHYRVTPEEKRRIFRLENSFWKNRDQETHFPVQAP